MVVLKFGGSSVGQPGRFNNAQEIVRQYRMEKIRPVVIASALSGVTDRLVDAASGASEGRVDRSSIAEWMKNRHVEHAYNVLLGDSLDRFNAVLEDYLVRAVRILKSMHEESESMMFSALRDELLAIGERLSVHLFAFALVDAGVHALPIDAATLIRTDNAYGAARVDTQETYKRTKQWFSSLDEDVVPIVTGFIGGTAEGKTTTLGRGGSDYSASILAAGVQAQKLERWTDVDGVYTSDPREDPTAKKLEYIVMEEALSWNKAGKMGLHRKALDPLITARIPLFVRSIDMPDKPGTEVRPRYQQAIAC